ncbi:MAG TPA: PEP-CTERM sorting domain-containing protein [Tepidisphaeraceae bacterium]|jgi:hypothetical protein|nr:PEP-CTERM sorting domain-containing protein [Tepidisphaeraceae bacterium]
MLRKDLYRVSLLAAVPAMLGLMGAPTAQAAYPFDLMTFDTSSTVKTTADFNPPPIITRYDFGGSGPNATHSTSWDGTVDNTGNSGGSVVQSVNFDTSANQAAAFTFDITNNLPVQASNLSFDIRLAPGSAFSQLGPGTSGASSGFMQVAIRDGSYTFTNTGNVFVNGNNSGSNGWNFGDPTFSGTSDAGTWEHISIPLSGFDTAVRAITIQDFDDNNAGRSFNGPVTWNIDNIQLTPAPEPASLALLGLGVPTLLIRRRKSS